MTLGEKQRMFTRLISVLIQHAYAHGYELTFGEAWRTKEQAEIYAKKGGGVLHSVHRDRLAVDFNLFRDGTWLRDSEQHKKLGEYWEALDPLCRWGGRWGDGNHYSLEHGGRK